MIVRSKTPLLYDALESKSGIIKPEIQSIKRNLKTGFYEIEIFDFLQVERENPEPGTAVYSYIFLRKRIKQYTIEQINQLFDLFGSTITKGQDEYDAAFIATLPQALLFTSNTTSVYGSEKKTAQEILSGEPGAFELVEPEIVPEPES